MCHGTAIGLAFGDVALVGSLELRAADVADDKMPLDDPTCDQAMIDRVYRRAGENSDERAIIPVQHLWLIVVLLDQTQHRRF